jgi:hypothetical protein
MIRIFCGGLGSGKSLSAIRVMKLRNQHTFVNQNIKLPKCHRLQITDIVKETEIPIPEGSKKKTADKKLEVNWEYWAEQREKYKDEGFDIFFDEIGQFLGSRNSMSGFGKKAMQWVAQVRKILGASELHDVIMVNQKLDGIDVDLRDYALEVTHCTKHYVINGKAVPATNKVVRYADKIPTKVWSGGKLVTKMIPKVIILQHVFEGEYAVNDYFHFRFQGKKTYSKKTFFVGNEYMQFYDSFEMIDFSPTTYA